MNLVYRNLHIRNAQKEDAALLAGWWNDGAVMAHAGFPDGLHTTVEKVASSLANDSENSRRLILEIDDVPAGEMNYHRISSRTAQIGIKICDVSRQNQGYGRTALSLLVKELFHMGVERIILDTDPANQRARHVYETLGFRFQGTRRCCWKDAEGHLRDAADYELRKGELIDFAEEKYDDSRLIRQLSFILEIDKCKNVLRQTHLSGHGRRENDAEHAWHMAVMAYLLQEYANEETDIARVMLMCLIHDIVEIDAGDTYAYDTEGLATQKEREEKAKERIFSLLPDDQKELFSGLFDEFEAGVTAEARFARALDNLQPLLLNDANDGGDWKEHGVHAEQVYQRQKRTKEGSERLYELTDAILKKHIRKGNLRSDDE